MKVSISVMVSLALSLTNAVAASATASVSTPATTARANTTDATSTNTTIVTTLPSSVKATYKVSRNGLLVGTVDEQFTRNGNRYTISSTTKAEGLAALITRDQLMVSSEGRVTPSGLVPSVFSSARKTDTKRNFIARFDWTKNEIVRERIEDGKAEKENFPLPKGTQDRLSSMYQFMTISPELLQAKSISTTMSQGKEAELYTYLKQGEPTITVVAGEFETIHYARDAKAGESKAEIWLAKSKNYVPIRIIFEDTKGNKLEQSLVDLVVTTE
jgi:Protein of unknown function (DUF3108)